MTAAEPCTGPATGDTLDFRELAALEALALERQAAALTQPFAWPAFTGPATGELLLLPGARQPRELAAGRAAPAHPALPAPPSDAEAGSYARRNMAPLACASLVSFGALLASQVQFMGTGWPLLAAFGLPAAFTVAYYLVSLRVNLFTRSFSLERHQEVVRACAPSPWPSLDVFLPVCGEPGAVLRNTWEHVEAMARRYPGTVTVYVLDDGASPEAREAAAGLGFTYAVRANRGWFKKAGNLRHAFERSDGEFILILDADFAPRPDMPQQMLPYFYADPALGIVQSPQYFRTRRRQSWTERGAGAVQELFYRMAQVSRDSHGGAICVGSCAAYRRAALDDIGGTALIEHSEDVHTGFSLRLAGWGLRYVPVPLAAGLCPSDPDSFLSQQYRWCAGSMSLLGSRRFWAARMPLRTRCCYLSGFSYYAHTALFTVAAPLIPLTLLALMPQQVRLLNYLLIVPSLLYNLVIFPAWHRCRFGMSAWMAKLLYGWAHLFCLADIIRGRRLGWQPTGRAGKKPGTARVWAAVAAWNGGTGIAWVGLGVLRTVQYGSASFALILAAGVFSCAVTGMALGARRNHDRAAARGWSV